MEWTRGGAARAGRAALSLQARLSGCTSDSSFVSKMSPEVNLAHLNFVKYIEKTFECSVERIDSHKYFGRAFEIWFKMITGGKSDQVTQC